MAFRSPGGEKTGQLLGIASGKLSHNYGKSPFFLMGKLTISMAIYTIAILT